MKSIFLTAALAAILLPCAAQKQWELRFGGGYDFPAGSQYLLNQSNSGTNFYDVKAINTSFGRGIGFHTDLTWWMNSWLGVTGGGSYHITSAPVKGYYRYYAVEYYSLGNSVWHSQVAEATAAIALRVPATRLHPYALLGVVLPLYTRITDDEDWESGGGIIPSHNYGTSKTVYRLRNTAGYTASLGIAPEISKHASLFIDIRLLSQAILARRSTLTSYKVQGVEKIDTYTVYGKETVYVKKQDLTKPYHDYEPAEKPIFSFPYSSIGIHAGIVFKL